MNPFQVTKIAQDSIEQITGQASGTVSRCEKSGENWSVDVEIVESKGRMSDNDIIANYVLEIDDAGELLRYERTQRYTRSQL